MTSDPSDTNRVPTILVVEDYQPMSNLLERVLRDQGYQVMSAATLRAAKAACDADVFDVIVTDFHIPGGSGADLVRHAARRRRGQRVLFVSGDAAGELDLRVKGVYADFLQKPFDTVSLLERVHRLLATDTSSS